MQPVPGKDIGSTVSLRCETCRYAGREFHDSIRLIYRSIPEDHSIPNMETQIIMLKALQIHVVTAQQHCRHRTSRRVRGNAAAYNGAGVISQSPRVPGRLPARTEYPRRGICRRLLGMRRGDRRHGRSCILGSPTEHDAAYASRYADPVEVW